MLASYSRLTLAFRGYSMGGPYVRSMAMLVKPVLVACLSALALGGAPASAIAGDRGQAQQGNISPRAIEPRIIAMMPPDAKYYGWRYDAQSNIYTFTFVRNGTKMWVDVDGRTGRIVRRSGS